MKHKTDDEIVEEFENLKCVNGAMYFGCVAHPSKENEQTLEQAEIEYKNWLRTIIKAVRDDERERIAALCYQLDTDGEKMYHLIFNSPKSV